MLKYLCQRIILYKIVVENIYELVSQLNAFAHNTNCSSCCVVVGSNNLVCAISGQNTNLASLTCCENRRL